MRVTRRSRRTDRELGADEPTAVSARGAGLPTLALLARVFEMTARGSGLSLTQYRALTVMADGPRRAARLAELVSVTRPTLTNTIDVLVGRGLIAREPAPDDRRGIVLDLTAEGKTTIAAIEKAFCAHLVRLVGADDTERLLEVLSEVGVAMAGRIAEQLATSPLLAPAGDVRGEG